MKTLIALTLTLFTLLTAVQKSWAQDDASLRTKLFDDAGPTRLSDLGMRLNPILGVSDFSYSGEKGGGHQKFTGGATVEFGQAARKLETGLLLVQAGGSATLTNGSDARVNNTYLAIPLMAKLRLVTQRTQSWYAKFGVLSAFAIGSSKSAAANPVDVLGSVGLGGRFVFTSKTDFLVEATYNRGFMDALQSTVGTYRNQGVLVLAGLSISI